VSRREQAAVRRIPATAKLNLALVVGPIRDDGKHELVTVFQRIDLADRIELHREPGLAVEGFADDTLVRGALEALAAAAGEQPAWRVRIHKRIPVAGGLGGGSSDAAAALRLANETLDRPLEPRRLHELARTLGADVPFFLTDGPQLGTGDGSDLEPLDLPQDYFVLLLLPHGAAKQSTGAVYADFDARDGAAGFDDRGAALRESLARVRRPRDLAALPPNDLASSPLAGELRALGAFRADVSGAGPAVYGLFEERPEAERARRALARRGRTWLTVPAWYG
jgi:4-diphosphocytidyl-2-C-methyl-D-erythritol kinase